jgi:hypothetical protein
MANMRILRQVLKAWLPLALVLTACCALVCVTEQQNLRQSANDPQIQMAEDAAVALAAGRPAQAVVPAGRVEIARSLAPFLIVFNAAGRVEASSAVLQGQLPSLPAGLLDSTRTLGEDRVTWQPAAGVRIAAVLVRVDGPQPGFVLAGRSLREVELRETQVYRFAALTWLLAAVGSLVLVILGELLLGEGRRG